MTKTKTTHTQKYASIGTCQSTHINAKDTANQTHTHIESKKVREPGFGDVPVASVDGKMSNANGKKSNRPQSAHTMGIVHVAAKKKKRFLPSTISTEAEQGNAKKVFVDGDSISGSESEDTPKKNINSSASIVIAPKAKTASVPTKNSFTPGPWAIGTDRRKREKGCIGYIPIVTDTYEPGMHGFVRVIEDALINGCETEANARLIAAAPTQNAVLRDLNNRVLDCEPCLGTGREIGTDDDACENCGGQGLILDATSLISDIRASIRKAEGK